MRGALLASLLLHGWLLWLLAAAMPLPPAAAVPPSILLLASDELETVPVATSTTSQPPVLAKPATAKPAVRDSKPADKPQPAAVAPAPSVPEPATEKSRPLPPAMPPSNVVAAVAANPVAMADRTGKNNAEPPAAVSGNSPGASGSANARSQPDQPARVRQQPKPPYPELSRERQEEGVVRLRLQLDALGRLQSVKLLQSSGFVRLDRAAREAVTDWQFSPGVQNGQPVPATLDVPVYFRLEQGG